MFDKEEQKNLSQTVDLNAENQQPDSVAQVAQNKLTASTETLLNQFIENNFTPEQQTTILNQIKQELSQNNGTCKITWKDEQEKDSISLVYQDNQLIKFKLYNQDVSEDLYQSQELRYQMKKDNAAAYKVISKTKQKFKEDKHHITQKTSETINVDEGDYRIKSSESKTDKRIAIKEIHASKEKRIETAIGTDGTLTETKSTEAKYTLDLGAHMPVMEAKRSTNTALYDDNQQVTKEIFTSQEAGFKGIGINIEHTFGTTEYADDGSSNREATTLKWNVSTSGLNTGVTHQTTTRNENGELLADNTQGFETTLGLGTIGAGVERSKTTVDENGNKTFRHDAIGGELQYNAFKSNFAHQTVISDKNNQTTYENSTLAETNINVGFIDDGKFSLFGVVGAGGYSYFNQTYQKDDLKRELSAQAKLKLTSAEVDVLAETHEQSQDRRQYFEAKVDAAQRELSTTAERRISTTDEYGNTQTNANYLSATASHKDKMADYNKVTIENNETTENVAMSSSKKKETPILALNQREID